MTGLHPNKSHDYVEVKRPVTYTVWLIVVCMLLFFTIVLTIFDKGEQKGNTIQWVVIFIIIGMILLHLVRKVSLWSTEPLIARFDSYGAYFAQCKRAYPWDEIESLSFTVHSDGYGARAVRYPEMTCRFTDGRVLTIELHSSNYGVYDRHNGIYALHAALLPLAPKGKCLPIVDNG